MADIIVKNPKLKKVVEWIEKCNPITQSFLATLAVFLVVGVIGVFFLGLHKLGGAPLVAGVGVFILCWVMILGSILGDGE